MWAAVLREAGHPCEIDDIRFKIGKGGDLLVPALLLDVAGDVRERIAERHGDVFETAYLDDVRPFPGATDLVRRVHASGRPVVLASSASGDELDYYVGLLGIAEIVTATTSADDADSSKLEPDIFGVALERAGVTPDEAIVIGDTVYDAEAAAKAGIAAIGLLSGPFDEAALRAAGAVTVYKDVASLITQFDNSPLAPGA